MTTIDEDNKKHMERFKFVPPSSSYIAGFIDGDGCIFIRKITDGYQSGIQISQCRTNVLQVIRYHFGGSITTSENRNNKYEDVITDGCIDKHNVRNQYNLLIRSNEYQILLDYIKKSFVIKQEQFDCLYEFEKLTNLPNKTLEKESLFNKCRGNNSKTNVKYTNFHKINIEYISGLFDAEGCIHINKNNYSKFYISISQKNHPLILYEIQKILGFGLVERDIDYVIYKKTECLNFIRQIRDYLIVKYNQVVALETYLTTEDYVIKTEMYNICNYEKHAIEHFNNLNQNEHGKERFNETQHLRKLKHLVCKEINMIGVYKEKSINMMGKNNHNYGKKFSKETRAKMSNSIRNSKGGVDDGTIIQVRQLINKGMTNIEIQNLLNLKRHTVTDIKTGKIVCRYETKPNILPMTNVEIALNKRKITTDEIITVIEKYICDWKPMQILDFLIDVRNNNNIQNTITIDIIKNIKRNLNKKKQIIYESELTHDEYECYKNLLIEYDKIHI